ncbi:sphingosine-1-phosphate phosphatase [Coprinopsis cinerea okayama7|uniref:Sphingosine-1-phosphate phosphatase n=1 Tax=Coprinopsis cinerea (strain Okayama-7 / 130 / ATCC MYA-4618 / FGSC 9003) TaxID=240176 RepID=A8P551_COPC7|nr:sphingosine-1-phosphate phosphatase [Coprinopsis cinerea okayama7\|eukprot:XP_001838877.1 sphingosine-1-phosphate phosphatase [Coprinopsis cinerea okayama7\
MPGRTHFSISGPDSAPSSRSASPAPAYDFNDIVKTEKLNGVEDVSPGQGPTDVYDTTLPAWRAAVRRILVKTVEKESRVIARMQNAIRTPWLDSYFVYTSLLGTHTFFMILLPAFAFFGHQDIARGLVMVLAAGVYLSSVLKDMFCSPRPFAPPVVRLTIGSHHLEYGFPSTHSTNSISIALFFFSIVHSLTYTSTPTISPQEFSVFTAILVFYAFSIVFGRLYTAMHSFTDCIMGTILGAGIWWGHGSWGGHPVVISLSNPLSTFFTTFGFGQPFDENHIVVYLGKCLGAGRWIEQWSENGGWKVPVILIPLCLLAVNQHPQPVDDCPCFEDAIAFGSVVLGALVGRWAMHSAGLNPEMNGLSLMPGSGWVQTDLGEWIAVERTWGDIGVWWAVAALKMAVGILTIFVWRIIAKAALHLILPPTFRLLSRVFRLPNRRFYLPATEYKNVPSDIHVTEDGTIALQAIPSVIDLPSSAGMMFETGGIGSGVDGSSHWNQSNGNGAEMKMRAVNGNGTGKAVPSKLAQEINGGEVHAAKRVDEEDQESKVKGAKHYDADVLTKVIVYAGIAFLACEALPLMFEHLGWGLRYSV